MSNKRNLYFRTSRDKVELVAENVLFEEAFGYMRDVLTMKGIKAPYYRVWGDNPKWIDFGSHTQFFIWGELQ